MKIQNWTNRILLSLILVVFMAQVLFAQDNPLKYEWGDRDGRQNPEHVIDFIGLEPGMTVADVGAGGGYFTILFAEAVGSGGEVIATDINSEYLAFIEKRIAEAGYLNVKTVLAGEKKPNLPEDSSDIVFLSAVYHHLSFPREYLENLRPALKSTGLLVIVETHKHISSHGSKLEEVIAQAVEAGYTLVRKDTSQPRYFIAVFTPTKQ